MKIDLSNKIFDLEKTLYSGQTPNFVFKEIENKHIGYVKEKKEHEPVILQQKNNQLKVETKASKETIKQYLGLKDELNDIYSKIRTDPVINDQIKKNKGLRITKTSPLFTVLVFLSSQNNSIYNIKNFIEKLSKKFGRTRQFNGKQINLPPTDYQLFNLKKKDFKECKAGYRAEYIKKTLEKIKEEEINLQELKKLNHNELRRELKKLPGIGEKVSDCISLFAYRNLEAFPVDTHIRKVIKKEYNKDLTDKEIREYSKEKWNDLAGYAQQYLYFKQIN